MNTIIGEDLSAVRETASAGLQELSGTTVLVAGAAGFLPSYVVDALAHANDTSDAPPSRILCIDNLKTGTPDRFAHLEGRSDVTFIHHDVTQELQEVEPDYIIHAASIASPTWYRKFPLETIDTNVTGTRRLLELARQRGVRGFVYLSSSEVYGSPPPEFIPTDEEYRGSVSSIGPRACYDESKRLAETLCMVYFRSFDVPVKIVRPFNVYGPRLRLDDGRVIPDFIHDAVNGRQITLYSDGEVTRSFCYVSDAAAAIIEVLATSAAGEVFNVGNDEEVSIRQVAELVDRLSPSPRGVRLATSADPEYLEDNPPRRCPDIRKIRDAIGWSPQIPLRKGIERTLRFHLEEPGRWT